VDFQRQQGMLIWLTIQRNMESMVAKY